MSSNKYIVLSNQVYKEGQFSIAPIRFEDRYHIMKWRNEQIYHLRQSRLLNIEDQDAYFSNVVSKLFEQKEPNQILFSYLKGDECIGYGGLVHINWIDKNAEISFIMNTALEETEFELHWQNYLSLIKKVAFNELFLHKIYTYAFDLRPRLYSALELSSLKKEAVLYEHCLFGGKFKDVIIHSCTNAIKLRGATLDDVNKTYEWAKDDVVRAFAFSKEDITFENHENWFFNKLKSNNTLYFILENVLNTSLGSIRIDADKNENKWIISYLIDPNYHGKGLGTLILKLLEEKLNDFPESFKGRNLVGIVIPDNIASIKIFRKLGYSEEQVDNTYIFSKSI